MQQFTDWSALSTSWFYNIQKGSKNIIGLKSVVGMESLDNGKRTQKSSYFKNHDNQIGSNHLLLWYLNTIGSLSSHCVNWHWWFTILKIALQDTIATELISNDLSQFIWRNCTDFYQTKIQQLIKYFNLKVKMKSRTQQ